MLTKPKDECNCFRELRVCQSATSCTLAESCPSPNPGKTQTGCESQTSLSLYTQAFCLSTHLRTRQTCCTCSSSISEKMRMPSMFSKRNRFSISWTKSLTHDLKTGGALVRPRGIIEYPKCPSEVLKAVFQSPPC